MSRFLDHRRVKSADDSRLLKALGLTKKLLGRAKADSPEGKAEARRLGMSSPRSSRSTIASSPTTTIPTMSAAGTKTSIGESSRSVETPDRTVFSPWQGSEQGWHFPMKEEEIMAVAAARAATDRRSSEFLLARTKQRSPEVVMVGVAKSEASTANIAESSTQVANQQNVTSRMGRQPTVKSIRNYHRPTPLTTDTDEITKSKTGQMPDPQASMPPFVSAIPSRHSSMLSLDRMAGTKSKGKGKENQREDGSFSPDATDASKGSSVTTKMGKSRGKSRRGRSHTRSPSPTYSRRAREHSGSSLFPPIVYGLDPQCTDSIEDFAYNTTPASAEFTTSSPCLTAERRPTPDSSASSSPHLPASPEPLERDNVREVWRINTKDNDDQDEFSLFIFPLPPRRLPPRFELQTCSSTELKLHRETCWQKHDNCM